MKKRMSSLLTCILVSSLVLLSLAAFGLHALQAIANPKERVVNADSNGGEAVPFQWPSPCVRSDVSILAQPGVSYARLRSHCFQMQEMMAQAALKHNEWCTQTQEPGRRLVTRLEVGASFKDDTVVLFGNFWMTKPIGKRDLSNTDVREMLRKAHNSSASQPLRHGRGLYCFVGVKTESPLKLLKINGSYFYRTIRGKKESVTALEEGDIGHGVGAIVLKRLLSRTFPGK